MTIIKAGAISALITSTLLSTTVAFAAPDANAVADRLVALLSQSGADVSYDQAVYNPADDVVMVINLKAVEDGKTASLATVSVKGYDEDNTEGFGSEMLSATGFEAEVDGGTLFVASMSISDLSIPTLELDTEKPESWQLKYSSAELINLNALQGDQPPVTVASVKSTANYLNDDGISGTGTLSVDDIKVPASIMDAEMKAFMDASGYENLILDVNLDGAYDATTQNLEMNNIEIKAAEMGTINFSAQFGGIVAEMLQDADQIQGLMATATLRGANLKFANDSIFEKGLDFAAQMTGNSAEQLKSQAPFVLGLGLGHINNPDFTKMVTEAVSAFLDEPKSLAVSLAPANPVPVAQIAGAAMSSPEAVPDLLAVGVVANQ
ncbi:MAG: hypothetical protein ABJO09_11330 [Hyphomicrobiales bacterium]